MNELLINKEKTLVFLVGTSKYKESLRFKSIPQVENNLIELFKIFSNKEIFGVNEKNIIPIHNYTYNDAYGKIKKIINSPGISDYELIIFYYVGHGDKDTRYSGGELYLSFTDTQKETLPTSAWMFSSLDKFLKTGRQNRIYIFDCCYSGAILNSIKEKDGSCLITSSSEVEISMASKGNKFTDFTGELISFFQNGLASKAARIIHLDTFKEIIIDKSNLNFQPQLRNEIYQKSTNYNFPFFYNVKCSLIFISKCIENGHLKTAEEFFFVLIEHEASALQTETKKVFWDLINGLILSGEEIRAAQFYIKILDILWAKHEIFQKEDSPLINKLNDSASAYYEKNKYEEALTRWQLIIEIAEKLSINFEDYYISRVKECKRKIEEKKRTYSKPAIISFYSSHLAVFVGTEIELRWIVDNADEIIISTDNNKITRSNLAIGKYKIRILHDHVFKIKASNNYDGDEKEVFIRAFPTPTFTPVLLPIPNYDRVINLKFSFDTFSSGGNKVLPQINKTRFKKIGFNKKDFVFFGYRLKNNSVFNNFNIYELYDRIRRKST